MENPIYLDDRDDILATMPLEENLEFLTDAYVYQNRITRMYYVVRRVDTYNMAVVYETSDIYSKPKIDWEIVNYCRYIKNDETRIWKPLKNIKQLRHTVRINPFE